eukprot:GEMP01003534.1.p1 GENE.GEMP01003534.1~~GEMP01003534.1.p1  ORF type:complete len:1134 (+),score=191.23 GEMP01003534.1:95-3496(+)
MPHLECFLGYALESLVNPQEDEWRTKRRWQRARLLVTNTSPHHSGPTSHTSSRTDGIAAKLSNVLDVLSRVNRRVRIQNKLQEEMLLWVHERKTDDVGAQSPVAVRSRSSPPTSHAARSDINWWSTFKERDSSAYCDMIGMTMGNKNRIDFYNEYRHFWHRLPFMSPIRSWESVRQLPSAGAKDGSSRGTPPTTPGIHFCQPHFWGKYVSDARGNFWCSQMSKPLAPCTLDFLLNSERAECSFDLSNGLYSNDHLDAAVEAVSNSKMVIKRINLAQGKFGDRSVRNLLEKIVLQEGNVSKVRSLDLSGNRLHAGSLHILCNALMSTTALVQLKQLNLSGVAIHWNGWQLLGHGLAKHRALRELDISQTTLGHVSQWSICELAKSMATSQLHKLNIGCNFIKHKGAMALGEMLVGICENGCLRELDISNNAGGFSVTCGAGEQFNPLLLLFEYLHKSTLRVLKCASCMLGADADTILECQLAAHPTMQVLDLSDNPHGAEGLRHLQSLVASSSSTIARIDLYDIHGSPFPLPSTQPVTQFFYSTPSNTYSLDLSHPAQRAVLCLLVRRAISALGNSEWETAWHSIRYKNVTQNSIVTTCPGPNMEDVPLSGRLNFNFFVDMANTSSLEDSEASVIRKYYRTGKMIVTFFRFLVLVQMYDSIRFDSMRWVFVQTMKLDLLLKMSHLRYFLRVAPELAADVMCTLLPAVEIPMDTKLHHVICSVTSNSNQMQAVRRQTWQFVWFSLHHCDGHYILDIDNPCNRRVLEQLFTLNVWHAKMAEARNIADVSPNGDRSSIRNLSSKMVQFRFFALSETRNSNVDDDGNILFVLPPLDRWKTGEPWTVELDYLSPWSTENKASMSQHMFEGMMKLFLSISMKYAEKVHALRAAIEHIVLDPVQLRVLLRVFPGDGKRPNLCSALSGTIDMRREAIREFGSVMKLVHAGGDTTNSFVRVGQNRKRGMNHCFRAEVFHMLFKRCTDQNMLVGTRFLYNFNEDALMSSRSVMLVKSRIGLLSTMNLMNLHCPGSTRGYRHVCDLRMREQRIFVKLCLELSLIEGSALLAHCIFQESLERPDGGNDAEAENRAVEFPEIRDFILPNSWMSDLPKTGTLSFIYECDACDVSFQRRLELGRQYLGW